MGAKVQLSSPAEWRAITSPSVFCPFSPPRHMFTLMQRIALSSTRMSNTRLFPITSHFLYLFFMIIGGPDTQLYTVKSRRFILALAMAASPFSLAGTIKLGAISMPRIHLGVYMTSGSETLSAVTEALDAGYRGFDSAEMYANEREVGSAIRKYLSAHKELKREDIWFTTKLATNNSYDATRKSIKESIKKSGLGYLDLYLLHSPYGGRERRLECWRAVGDAVKEGEVRTGGVSNFGVRHVGLP